MTASFVLSRVSRCGVAQGYASLAPLPAALLDGHFEHPGDASASRCSAPYQRRDKDLHHERNRLLSIFGSPHDYLISTIVPSR
jgi:hypothetical protein